MKIECSVEELIKIVSVKNTDTINIRMPLVSSKFIENLNQEKNQ